MGTNYYCTIPTGTKERDAWGLPVGESFHVGKVSAGPMRHDGRAMRITWATQPWRFALVMLHAYKADKSLSIITQDDPGGNCVGTVEFMGLLNRCEHVHDQIGQDFS